MKALYCIVVAALLCAVTYGLIGWIDDFLCSRFLPPFPIWFVICYFVLGYLVVPRRRWR